MVDKSSGAEERFTGNSQNISFFGEETSKEISTNVVREIDLPITNSAHSALRQGMLDRLSFSLGQGIFLTGRIINSEEISNNFIMCTGILDDGKEGNENIELNDASNFTITYNGEALYGILTVDDRRVYEMYSDDGKNCHIVELDLERIGTECGVTGLGDSSLLEEVLAYPEKCRLNQQTSTDTTVSVLVLYTTAARKAIGEGPMEALINSCIQETNTAFANSNIRSRVKLAVGEGFNGMQEVGYRETGSDRADLSNLGNRSHSILKIGHQLRDKYDADIISLIVENLNSAGIANIPRKFNQNWSSPFNVVHRGSALSNLSFTHELAHNMGAGHVYNSDDVPPSICDYSFGSRWEHKGKKYRSVMAYPPGQRVPYFSGPDVYYPNPSSEDKVSTGTDKADNARTIRNTVEFVSKFRPRP